MADRYDLAEFDDPHGGNDHSTNLDAARAERDAAAFQTFMSETTSALTALRADLATRKVADLEQSKRETEQRKAIFDRLVDPEAVATAAMTGAQDGLDNAFDSFLSDFTATLKEDADAHTVSTRAAAARLDSVLHAAAERQSQFIDHINRTEDARQSLVQRLGRIWVAGGAIIALLVLLAAALGYWQGSSVGQAQGYADAHDEVAAASWANTSGGKLARQLDLINPALFGKMQDCNGQGWDKHRVNGRKACLSGPTSEGWWREKP